MTQDEAFLKAILADPAADAPRLVYADWLEENGQCGRAEFLRGQCELEKCPRDNGRRKQIEARGRELLARHREEWLAAFLVFLDDVPWLKHLGKPTARDNEMYRLHDWEEWPGPEDPDCYALAVFYQNCYDGLLARAGLLRQEAESLWDQVRQSVFNRAKQNVPFDPEEDAWHGPTQCVWDVSYWAGLITLYLLLRQVIPTDVSQVWSWIAAGHWPCGYFEAPPGNGGRKLMVY